MTAGPILHKYLHSVREVKEDTVDGPLNPLTCFYPDLKMTKLYVGKKQKQVTLLKGPAGYLAWFGMVRFGLVWF